jgi:hypothetical protein
MKNLMEFKKAEELVNKLREGKYEKSNNKTNTPSKS